MQLLSARPCQFKVYLRSLRIKNRKKRHGTGQGMRHNINIEDEEIDLMEELPLALEILFLHSPKQCKQLFCLDSICLWKQQHRV